MRPLAAVLPKNVELREYRVIVDFFHLFSKMGNSVSGEYDITSLKKELEEVKNTIKTFPNDEIGSSYWYELDSKKKKLKNLIRRN